MSSFFKFSDPPVFVSHASVGGFEEKRGSLGSDFDFCDTEDNFGMDTFEKAEGEMERVALNIALSKAGISHESLGLLVAGDLQNQCVASSLGLFEFGVPYLGIYGACSTCTEALLILSSFLCCGGKLRIGAAVTSSHNSAAERQFRFPLEYGGQRPASAQWTSTAAGAFILEKQSDHMKENFHFREDIRGKERRLIRIECGMPGRIIDGATSDGSNMGAAMAFSAADSIKRYFELSGDRIDDIDYIVTGDLGRVGSDILRDILKKEMPKAERRHTDCGLLLYDLESQDAHSGASGCGTSAAVLSSYFIPALERGEINSILFSSTGALMSPQGLLQGDSILGIAPIIKISAKDI